MMHNIACIYAQAVTRVETELEEKDRQTLATAYRRCAVAAVGRTLQMLRPEERAASGATKFSPTRRWCQFAKTPAFTSWRKWLVDRDRRYCLP